MHEISMITENPDAALRGNFSFVSKNVASGKSTIANKNENKRGERISLPKTAIKPIAIKVIKIMASFV